MGRPLRQALDKRGLAKRLKPYGIKSKDVRIRETVRKGYARGDFLNVWERYLPACSGVSATIATSATDLISKNNFVADVADVAEGGQPGRYRLTGQKLEVADMLPPPATVPPLPKSQEFANTKQIPTGGTVAPVAQGSEQQDAHVHDRDRHVEAEERSAILEYDAGLPREEAQAQAATEFPDLPDFLDRRGGLFN